MQVEGLEELLHGDLFSFKFVHDTVRVHTVRLLDEAQQVLLIHAGSSMDVGVHLAEIKIEWITDVWSLFVVTTVFGHKREV